MKDQHKSKARLITELEELRHRLAVQTVKKEEETLRESEEKYRTIINESPIGIFHYDMEGTITECNKKFVEIIGSSRDKLIGLNMVNKSILLLILPLKTTEGLLGLLAD